MNGGIVYEGNQYFINREEVLAHGGRHTVLNLKVSLHIWCERAKETLVALKHGILPLQLFLVPFSSCETVRCWQQWHVSLLRELPLPIQGKHVYFVSCQTRIPSCEVCEWPQRLRSSIIMDIFLVTRRLSVFSRSLDFMQGDGAKVRDSLVFR
jgi:hypothetical protein